MRRALKITAITLGSLLAVVLLVVCIAVYVVFTPKQLTPIVRNVAAQYITCPHEVGEVELTFFSTFPEVGLRLNGLYVINPMPGAPSDTVLVAPEAVLRLNIPRYLTRNELEVKELTLSRTQACLFMDESGRANWDVLALTPDTAEEDTTALSLPFDALQVEGVRLHITQASYLSLRDSLDLSLSDATIKARADNMDDISLSLEVGGVNAAIGGEIYAQELPLRLKAPHTAVQLGPIAVTLHKARVEAADFALLLDGSVVLDEDGTRMSLTADAREWDIPALLRLLPRSVTKTLDGIEINSALATLHADVHGVYNDTLMPIVDATLTLEDGEGAYMEVFPYRLTELATQVQVHMDWSEADLSCAVINSLHARTGKTVLDADGDVTHLLGDPLLDLRARVDVRLEEFRRYLAAEGQDNSMSGRAQGSLAARIRLSHLSNMHLDRGLIRSDLRLTDLHVLYDSMTIDMPAAKLALRLPNSQPARETVRWMEATLSPSALRLSMPGLSATAGATDLQVQTSDVLSGKVLCARLALQSRDALQAETDSMSGTIQAPDMTAYVEYDSSIDDAIPTADVTLRFADFIGHFDDIAGHLESSTVTAKLSGSRRDKTQPRAKVTLTTEGLKAQKGQDMRVQTRHMELTAAAVRNPKQEQLLLQWNPRLSVRLQEGAADMAGFNEQIRVPEIDFDYSNRRCTIHRSEVQVGNSQFALEGEVRNIGKWLDKKAVLEGELNFTSDFTDVNQLMDLCSASSGSEETAPTASPDSAAAKTAEEANPFLVPTDVDLVLNTHIREAAVFDQLARDLGGRLYIKDGTLILEEMGFICNAAKLQLTGIYRTPRRDHIYVGLDYHMLDINIQELVNMIPQIDTMMPMLRSFRGDAEFHIACETYTHADYSIKPSTIRGACSIEGKDLVLLDGETFSQIAKLLMFKKQAENKVDSLSAQFTIYKDEIDIYPFCLTMDKYTAAVGGHHNLDMTFDYHISLLRPLHLGVDVSGTFDDLKIRLAKCRYAEDFQPARHQDVETQTMSLKRMISAMLKSSVRQPATE